MYNNNSRNETSQANPLKYIFNLADVFGVWKVAMQFASKA